MRPYILAENNWKTVKETEYKLAVLPWGATEAHNYHLLCFLLFPSASTQDSSMLGSI